MALGEDDGLAGEFSTSQVQYSRSLSLTAERELNPFINTSFDDQREKGDFDLLLYWQFVWKHRLIFIITVVISIAAAMAATLLTTPKYTAQMTLEIDREAAKVLNVQDVSPREDLGNGAEFYQTQYGLLKSRALAERVVDALDLTNSPAFLHATGLDRRSSAVLTEKGRRGLQEAAIGRVKGGLSVNPVRGSRLVQIAYTSTSPTVAADLANGVAEGFIAMNLDRKFESSSYAREFLEKQIAATKDKLEASERQAVAYAVKQQIINLHDAAAAGGADSHGASESLTETNLAALNAAYAAATAARIAAEQRWRQSEASTGVGLSQVLQNPTVQDLSKTKAQLQAQYQDNLRLYQPDYPSMVQLKAQIDEIDHQIQTQAGSIRQSLKEEYLADLNQEKALNAKVDSLKASMLNLKERSIQYNFLERELDTNRILYDGLLQRYKEVGVTAGVTTNNISIIDRASPPRAPSSPKPLINVLMALAMGLGAATLTALAAETLDQAIRQPGDVERKLNLPLLGSIPLLAKGVSPKEAMRDPRSHFWEAYFSVRTALQFSTTDGVPRSLLVISTRPGEGKTTTSVALAHSLARLGAKTLLIDADLRKPSLHQLLGLSPALGLSNVLAGANRLDQVVQDTEQPGLWVITSGPLPPTPAELLADNRLRLLCAEAEERFDVVIFDGPPVMGFADAPLISAVVAGTVLVVEAAKIRRGQVIATLHRLRMARAKVIGAVLAKFDARKAVYGDVHGGVYNYHYNYAYGQPGGRKLKDAAS
jgi:capsular exopolysaccharide synthesis family protein